MSGATDDTPHDEVFNAWMTARREVGLRTQKDYVEHLANATISSIAEQVSIQLLSAFVWGTVEDTISAEKAFASGLAARPEFMPDATAILKGYASEANASTTNKYPLIAVQKLIAAMVDPFLAQGHPHLEPRPTSIYGNDNLMEIWNLVRGRLDPEIPHWDANESVGRGDELELALNTTAMLAHRLSNLRQDVLDGPEAGSPISRTETLNGIFGPLDYSQAMQNVVAHFMSDSAEVQEAAKRAALALLNAEPALGETAIKAVEPDIANDTFEAPPDGDCNLDRVRMNRLDVLDVVAADPAWASRIVAVLKEPFERVSELAIKLRMVEIFQTVVDAQPNLSPEAQLEAVRDVAEMIRPDKWVGGDPSGHVRSLRETIVENFPNLAGVVNPGVPLQRQIARLIAIKPGAIPPPR